MKEHIERFVDNMELEAKFNPLNNELHIVEGYASTEGIDLAGHNIPLEAMDESLPRFMSNELFRNLMVSHNSTQVGVILDEFDGVKTHVDEKGIYFVAQIRDDIKTANKLWDLIQNSESEIGVSIKFEVIENEQVCNKEKCWTNILKFNIIEFSLTDKGVNPDCYLTLSETIKEGSENVVSKSASSTDVEFAEWSTKYKNSLPDSSFAFVEECYKRGETKNKNARHLPYKDKEGNLDESHVRNGLARVNQIKPVCKDTNREDMINTARKRLQSAAKKLGIGNYSKVEDENITKTMEEGKSMDENATDNTETEETSTEMSVSVSRDYDDEKLDAILGQMGELAASIASVKEELSASNKADEDVAEESKTEDELSERVDVVEKSLGDMSLKLEEMNNSEIIENLQKSISARDKLIEGQKEEIQKLSLRVEELENEPSTKFVSEGKTNETPIMETYTDQFGSVSQIN